MYVPCQSHKAMCFRNENFITSNCADDDTRMLHSIYLLHYHHHHQPVYTQYPQITYITLSVPPTQMKMKMKKKEIFGIHFYTSLLVVFPNFFILHGIQFLSIISVPFFLLFGCTYDFPLIFFVCLEN